MSNSFKPKIPVSVEVLTYNNEDTLERCLKSVADFDDIIVLDGGSTDGTVGIVRRYNVRLIPQHDNQIVPTPITDFSKVRNRGLKTARHDWFLFVDSDEFLTLGLVEEIRHIVSKSNPKYFLWYVPRKNLIRGMIRDCSTTYPGLQLRFFNRLHASLFEKAVHETVRSLNGEPVGVLREKLIAALPELGELRKKWFHYLEIEAVRLERASAKDILRKIYYTLRAALLYLFRLPQLLLCRGARAPLSYELARQEYNLRLLYILLKKLLFL